MILTTLWDPLELSSLFLNFPIWMGVSFFFLIEKYFVLKFKLEVSQALTLKLSLEKKMLKIEVKKLAVLVILYSTGKANL